MSNTDRLRDRLRRLPSLAGMMWPFDTDGVPAEPVPLFIDWLDFAIDAGLPEPHVATLSTVDADGRPDARMLILKNLDESGWHFASSSASAKGRQIAANPNVALTFYWRRFGRQVRIRGMATTLGRDAARDDFMARSAEARAVASLGNQSQPLASAEQLGTAYDLALGAHDDRSHGQSSWALHAVSASDVEFFQARQDRRHIRLLYTASGNGWVKSLLWP